MKQFSGDETPEETDALCRGDAEVGVSRLALSRLLDRFQEGALDASSLTRIAGLLEGECTVYETSYGEQIATMLFLLATPEINGPVDSFRAEECQILLRTNRSNRDG
ncbi:MAG TPA: hypothetical protein VK843_17225 [Planctomycetota bacterium]|nr:hypothetical protein [Planctomycetota bacterium]